jgi:hypothetical protein
VVRKGGLGRPLAKVQGKEGSAAPVQDNEPALQLMCDIFERVADNAKAASVQRIVRLAALYQIERKKIHIKPSKPFDNRLEDESWVQYKVTGR